MGKRLSRGRAEKIVQGITGLEMTGTVQIKGDLLVSGSCRFHSGTMQYCRTLAVISTNTTFTANDSGKHIGYVGTNNITCYLPDGAAKAGMEFTFFSLREGNGFRITGSSQGGSKNCFVGTILGSTGSSPNAHGFGVYTSTVSKANQINCDASAFGDSITLVSTGDLAVLGDSGGSRWIIKSSNVKHAKGNYEITGS